jgi:hypothetical protein
MYRRKRGVKILRFIKDTCKSKTRLLSALLASGDSDLSVIVVELCVNVTFNPDLKIGANQRKTLRNHAKVIAALARCSELPDNDAKSRKAGSILKRQRDAIPLLLLIGLCAGQLGL